MNAVPTVIAFKNGKVVDNFVGVKDDADLESFIKKLSGEWSDVESWQWFVNRQTVTLNIGEGNTPGFISKC